MKENSIINIDGNNNIIIHGVSGNSSIVINPFDNDIIEKLRSLNSTQMDNLITFFKLHTKEDISIFKTSLNNSINTSNLQEHLHKLLINEDIVHNTVNSFVLFDIDAFTLINRKHGTKIGNNIKQTIHQLVGNTLIEKDLKTISGWLFGFDEYFIAFKAPVLSIHSIPNELSTKIEKYDWHKITNNLRVTCSFTITDYAEDETIDDLVARTMFGVEKAKTENNTSTSPKYFSGNSTFYIKEFITNYGILEQKEYDFPNPKEKNKYYQQRERIKTFFDNN